jgi:hypothetical protein
MLVGVAGREEAEIAIAAGADIVEFWPLKSTEHVSAVDAAGEIVSVAAGRCLTSAFAGELREPGAALHGRAPDGDRSGFCPRGRDP